MNTNKTIIKGLATSLLCIIIALPAFAREAEQQKQQVNSVQAEEVKAFSEVYHQIKRYYVSPVKDEKLFENAIRGMLNGLDPHSDYLNKQEFKALHDSTAGKFAGLGIQIGVEHGFLKVITPLDDTPAQRAGIKAGDYIVRLNSQPVTGMTLREAMNIMRGKKGTSITLTIVRKGSDKPLIKKVVRDYIRIKSVKSDFLDKKYAYVRVSQFQLPTVKELKKTIEKYNRNKNVEGLILDLRNNPGGLLDSAVDMSDLFLDRKSLGKNKLIVYTKGRLQQSVFQIEASDGDILNGAPIVVLINEGSASSSEIVAGALQDHGRAIIVGSKSFGKGTVQTVLPIGNSRGIKITTAMYYTPLGRNIQAKGIEPDVSVKDIKLAESVEVDDTMQFIREENLSGHIEMQDGKVKSSTKKSVVSDTLKDDYQLQQALNVLKGLQVQQKHIVSRQ